MLFKIEKKKKQIHESQKTKKESWIWIMSNETQFMQRRRRLETARKWPASLHAGNPSIMKSSLIRVSSIKFHGTRLAECRFARPQADYLFIFQATSLYT